MTMIDERTLTKSVTDLEKYTEYQFSLHGSDGPNSSVEIARTKEDRRGLSQLKKLKLYIYFLQQS